MDLQKRVVKKEQEFSDQPCSTVCRHCNRKIVTYVEQQVTAMTYLVCMLLLLIFGWLSLILIPLAIFLTRSAIHRCSYCMNQIAERTFASMPSLDSKVFVFKFGRCQVVLSRKYALILFAVLVIGCVYYLYINTDPENALSNSKNPGGARLSATWEEYLQDCGANQVINNEVRARGHFDTIYRQNIVQWDGYFTTMEILQTSTFVLNDGSHSVNIGVKMQPSESAVGGDMVIGYHAKYYKQQKAVFDGLKPGDHILFQAFLAEMGDEYRPHHLHGTKLWTDGAATLDLRNVNVRTTKVHLQTESHKQVQKSKSSTQEEQEQKEQEGEEN